MNNWRQHLPELEQSTDPLTSEIFDNAQQIDMPAGSTVFQQGDACNNYLVILEGKVKVFTRADNGREIVLYRLIKGDSCVLTTSCLFGNKNYPAEGVTETAVTAIAIPAATFREALQKSSNFREIVFAAFSSHLTELITLVEEVAFGKIDVRLAKHLLRHCDDQNTLHSTHQNIATDLGSAREVISRQLKELESRGFIIVNRGSITITNSAALQQLGSE